MGKETNIPWCDATWNPWYGCERVSPACDNCYAQAEMKRYGKDPGLVQHSKTTFYEPCRWSRKKSLPIGSRIFTCSWSDFFIDRADTWRAEAWDIIRATPEYNYLILTKRPERIEQCLPADWCGGWSNVGLGVTAENQTLLDRRMMSLSMVPSVMRFVSLEPLLESVLLNLWVNKLNWVIAGGENGPHARPVHQNWIRELASYCQSRKIPFFFKGWGRWLPTEQQRSNVPDAWLARDPIMRSGPAGSGNPVCLGTWFNAGEEAGDLLDGKTYHETPFGELQPAINNTTQPETAERQYEQKR